MANLIRLRPAFNMKEAEFLESLISVASSQNVTYDIRLSYKVPRSPCPFRLKAEMGHSVGTIQ